MITLISSRMFHFYIEKLFFFNFILFYYSFALSILYRHSFCNIKIVSLIGKY